MDVDANGFALDSIDELNTDIKKILLATDGSMPSIIATQYAVALARTFGASLKAVFVSANDTHLQSEALIDRESLKESRPSAAGLDLVLMYANKNDISCETETIHGNVASAIIKSAERFGADLIIVGNTGRTGLRKLALGSVAEAVVKNSRIPVLVLKAS